MGPKLRALQNVNYLSSPEKTKNLSNSVQFAKPTRQARIDNLFKDWILCLRRNLIVYPFCYFCIVLFIFIITPAAVSAQTNRISISWNPNHPAERVTQYRIYYKTGNSGPPYTGTSIDQGNSPIIIRVNDLIDENNPKIYLTGLNPYATYRFALTAFNGNESNYSNEASYAAQALSPGVYHLLLSQQN